MFVWFYSKYVHGHMCIYIRRCVCEAGQWGKAGQDIKVTYGREAAREAGENLSTQKYKSEKCENVNIKHI